MDGCGVVGPEDVEGVVPLVVVGGLASEGVKVQSSEMKSNASIAMYPFSLCPRTASIRIFKNDIQNENIFEGCYFYYLIIGTILGKNFNFAFNPMGIIFAE